MFLPVKLVSAGDFKSKPLNKGFFCGRPRLISYKIPVFSIRNCPRLTQTFRILSHHRDNNNCRITMYVRFLVRENILHMYFGLTRQTYITHLIIFDHCFKRPPILYAMRADYKTRLSIKISFMLKMSVCKSRALCTKEISFQSLKNVYSVFTIRHLCLREQSPPFVLSEISKVLFEPPVHKKKRPTLRLR